MNNVPCRAYVIRDECPADTATLHELTMRYLLAHCIEVPLLDGILHAKDAKACDDFKLGELNVV